MPVRLCGLGPKDILICMYNVKGQKIQESVCHSIKFSTILGNWGWRIGRWCIEILTGSSQISVSVHAQWKYGQDCPIRSQIANISTIWREIDADKNDADSRYRTERGNIAISKHAQRKNIVKNTRKYIIIDKIHCAPKICLPFYLLNENARILSAFENRLRAGFV